MYEMFMGPLEMQKPWNTKNILGVRRFLDRVWKLKDKVSDESSASIDMLMHQTIKKVTDDIEMLKLNTAISQLMIALNAAEESGIGIKEWEAFLQLLAPFAPHIAHELAEEAGISDWEHWPSYDLAKLASATVVVAVQVNGKARGTIELTPDATEDEAVSKAREVVHKWLGAGEKRHMYVPGRIVNFVI